MVARTRLEMTRTAARTSSRRGAQLLGDFPGSRRVDWTSLLLVFV
ncbi:hypothetical protein [Kitasatospora sp. MBT66]|nr:hypothetical protein [Kitasatospora sp. MBT66]